MKKLRKNKENAIPVDENGNPIEEEKKSVDVKGIGKKILCTVATMVGGVVLFLVIGAAMTSGDDSDNSSEPSDSDSSDSESNVSEDDTSENTNK